MAAPELLTGWRALSNAVAAHDWPETERLATDLADRLEHALTANRKLLGDRDGLYVIGWQHMQAAPRRCWRAVERVNTALRRWPPR